MSLKPSLEHVELRMENYTYLLAILGQEFFVGWPYISSNIFLTETSTSLRGRASPFLAFTV